MSCDHDLIKCLPSKLFNHSTIQFLFAGQWNSEKLIFAKWKQLKRQLFGIIDPERMACSRSVLDPFGEKVSDEIREIFEICKNGDVSKVRRYIMNGLDLNIRDTAGRKSSPLHFAAGEYLPHFGWKY